MASAVHNGENGAGHLSWLPIRGRWEIGDTGPIYLGNEKAPEKTPGVIASNRLLRIGACRVKIRLASGTGESAGIVIGYVAQERSYVYAELGGQNSAYVLGEFSPGRGWDPLVKVGKREILLPDHEYLLRLRLQGQEVRVWVDDVPVIEYRFPNSLIGNVGLLGYGDGPTSFTEFQASDERPVVFVAMAFQEPFETLYREVIQKQAEEAGFQANKIDEKPGPGVIFQDMQQAIERADVVIAEVSPSNPNVFYEIGYAHALNKPTILLARRGSELPFDIRSYRVVFYDDTIGGKPEVERSLRRHLNAIADR
jgi:hypothetical protein